MLALAIVDALRLREVLAGEVRARARVMDRVQDTGRVQDRDMVQVRVGVRVSVRFGSPARGARRRG